MATPAVAEGTPVVRVQVTVDRRAAAIGAVLVLQALWLGALMLGGWYSGADLPNLALATGRPLDGDYLTLSAGGHFGVPARTVYWVLNRVAPLSWGLTVVGRVLLQAAATYLLWRLLEELVGRRRWIGIVVALYAFSPLLVPASFVLSNALGVMVAQTAVLGASWLHVRYTRTGRVWLGLAAAPLVLLGLLFADESILIVVLLPALSLGFLHQGTLRDRLRGAARRWPGWLSLALMAVVLRVVYATGDYVQTPHGFTLGNAWDVARTEWTQVLGPALLGGPWVWSYHDEEWAAYGAAPAVLRLLGQVALLLLVGLSVRRTGRRALLAWAIPVVSTIGGAVLVGYARHDFLGVFIAPVLRYSYYTALMLAVGVTLAFARTVEEGGDFAETQARPSRRLTALAGLVLVAEAVSTLGFATRFWANPAPGYVDRLAASARKAGPSAEVYDTPVPNEVLPRLSPNHFVSDVLGLVGVPIVVGRGAALPLIADDSGRLVASTFVPVADVTSPTLPTCGTPVRGPGSPR